MPLNPKHVRPGKDGWPGAATRRDVIEGGKQVRRCQRQPHLLLRLPDGGREQVLILFVPPASGKPHVPGPRVSRSLGSLDDEQRIRIGADHDSHRSLLSRRVCDMSRLSVAQPLGDSLLELAQGRLHLNQLTRKPAHRLSNDPFQGGGSFPERMGGSKGVPGVGHRHQPSDTGPCRGEQS